MNFYFMFFEIALFKTVICEHKTYDFIVIGGGTAGSIVAARLSEIQCFNVLVLEAGGEPPPIISNIPVLAGLMRNTKVDWNFTSEPQKYALLNYPNRIVDLTQGLMLGGTGSINNLNFFRGNKLDYDNWESNGAQGWSWNDVLPYFKKIEDDYEIGVDYDDHGHNGPICITNPGRTDPLIKRFTEAMGSFGYPYKDPNGDGTQTGHSYASLNKCYNIRRSTYFEYLRPAMKRNNLKVIKHAFVEKIIFSDKQAVGAIYVKNGKRKKVMANKEIIVSAGAINSPRILMLSGVGPRRHLSELEIPVIVDLPVGLNLHDHFNVSFTFTTPYEDIYNNETVKQFFFGNGPLIRFSHGNAFVNTIYSKNYLYPDMQFSLRGFSAPQKPGDKMKYILRAYMIRPKSRGFIHLNSNNPFDYPKINPQYLSNEEDVFVLAEGAKIAYNVMKSMNTDDIGYRETKLNAPNCDIYEKFKSDEYWYCIVRSIGSTGYHYGGTCKMGNEEDDESVVDSNLRVIGVSGLRVIDASIMPRIVSSNLQAAVMMIAEKGSDLVKQEHDNCICNLNCF